MAVSSPEYINAPGQQLDTPKGSYVRLTITGIENTDQATNQAKISWKITVEGTRWVTLSAYQVYLGGKEIAFWTGTKNSWYAGDILTSGTTTFDRNADGSLSLSASVKQLFYYAYTATRFADSSKYQYVEGTFTFDTVPRTSVPSLSPSSQTVGGVIRINTNRYSSFTHTIYYSIGNISNQQIASGVGDYYDWTLPTEINNQITSGSSLNGTIRVVTDGVGENSVTFTANVPSSIVPSVSAIDISEGNSAITSKGWDLGTQTYIQALSTLNVSITASGNSGSSISSYSTTIGSTQKTGQSFSASNLTYSGTQTVTATVTDSRQRTASLSTSVNFIEYSNPTITLASAKRCTADGEDDDNGTYLKYSFKGSVSPINNGTSDLNSKSYKISYRVKDTSTWTDVTITNDSYTIDKSDVVLSGVTFSDTSAFEIKFVITDSFGSTEIAKTLDTGFDLINWNAEGNGMAFGKISEKENAVEIGDKLTLYYHGVSLNNLIVVKRYSVTIGALAANGEVYDQYTTFTPPTGYTQLCIGGYGLYGNYYTKCGIPLLELDGESTLKYSVSNYSTTQETQELTLYYDVVFIKN